MSLLRYEEHSAANSLARPVFDSVTDLISIHLEDRQRRLPRGSSAWFGAVSFV